MLHKRSIGSGADDTKAYGSTLDGKFYNENMKPQHETEAKSLLPVSLLPKSNVTGYATVGASIRDLAQLLQVSPPAMRMRLDTLGIAHNGERVAGSAEVVSF